MARRSWLLCLAVWIALALAPGTGCRRDNSAQQVRDLRIAGQLDSARTRALGELAEHSDRMSVWMEFARTELALARLSSDENAEAALQHLVQAGLVSAGMWEFSKHDPGKLWRETAKLVSAEVSNQVNQMTTTVNLQTQSVTYIKQTAPSHVDSVLKGSDLRAQRMVSDYRDNARRLIYWSVVLRRLLESLPEITTGTTSLLSGQMDNAMAPWAQALELDEGFISSVQQRARQQMDGALAQTQTDLRDLGYFLPATIVENGVTP